MRQVDHGNTPGEEQPRQAQADAVGLAPRNRLWLLGEARDWKTCQTKVGLL